MHDRRVLWAGPTFRWSDMMQHFLARCVAEFKFVQSGRVIACSDRVCDRIVRVAEIPEVVAKLKEAAEDRDPFDLVVTMYGGNIANSYRKPRFSFATQLLRAIRRFVSARMHMYL